MNNKKQVTTDKINKDNRYKNAKLGFIQKVVCSIFKVETYPEMAAQGCPRTIKYLMTIVLIFGIVCAIFSASISKKSINDAIKYIEEESPNISYKNGTLNFETNDAYEFKNDKLNINLIINTNEVTEEQIQNYKKSLNKVDFGIIALKDRIVLASQKAELFYTDIFNINEFGKQDIINYLKENSIVYVSGIGFTTLLVTFIVYLIIKVVNVLVISLTGVIASRFVGIKMRYIAIFNMSVYSITLSSILELIYLILNMFTTFNIKYFDVMYMGVATIYLITALFMLKLDYIQHNQELSKILEIQKQVKREIEQEKEEKQKTKEKKKEESEKNKKDEEGVYNE